MSNSHGPAFLSAAIAEFLLLVESSPVLQRTQHRRKVTHDLLHEWGPR